MKPLPQLPPLDSEQRLDRDHLEAVSGGGEAKSWTQWVGDQVAGALFPTWGVQGQTTTPGGGNAQYRVGDTPTAPKMPPLPALK